MRQSERGRLCYTARRALNALDASALLKHIIGLAAGENPEVSDLNGDNTVNALDAAIILKKAAGL